MATKTNSYNDRGSTCVSALKNLYVAMGGELTDTYSDIASGAAVSTLTIIPDCVNVVAKQATKNQPSGKLSITSTAEVACSAYATAQVSDADLVAENIKKDVNILGVTGSYEGGGGSSDFSTAEVTITNNSTSPMIVYAPIVVDSEGQTCIVPSANADSLPTVNIAIYKGTTLAQFDETITHSLEGIRFSTTGNAEVVDVGIVMITGDCTITITST